MCCCFKINSGLVGEDPNCPTHGTTAQRRENHASSILSQLEQYDLEPEVKELIDELASLVS